MGAEGADGALRGGGATQRKLPQPGCVRVLHSALCVRAQRATSAPGELSDGGRDAQDPAHSAQRQAESAHGLVGRGPPGDAARRPRAVRVHMSKSFCMSCCHL